MTLRGMTSRNYLLLIRILACAMYTDHMKEHEESSFSFFGKENLWRNREYILKYLLPLY